MAPLCQINGFFQVLFIAEGLCILKSLLKRIAVCIQSVMEADILESVFLHLLKFEDYCTEW